MIVALPKLPIENLYLVSRGIKSPHKKSPPPYDDFKISPQPICSYRSHKYDNFYKTTYKVSPFSFFPQANLFTKLFANLRLTLDHYRGAGAASQISC